MVTLAPRSMVVCAFFVALMTMLLALLAATRGQAQIPPSPFVEVGRTVRPAVVSIRTIRLTGAAGVNQGPLQEMYRRYFPDAEGEGGRFEMPSTGSGFVVAVGHILTNHHVIDAADEIFVRFGGERREYRARLQGTDPNTDLALLTIDPDGRDMPVLEFADSDAVEVGSWAVAVGNPFGNLESSLTVGVVSAKGRGDLVIGGLTPRFQDFIQTDASINFGNSGGPLVDVSGRVIGVNTAINSRGQGIGFAVPSNLAWRIYRDLRDHGRVIRGYLGVSTEDLVLVVGEQDGGGPDGGARVIDVVADSPAAAAGLRQGDIITAWDDRPVGSRRELLFMVAGTAPGTELELEIDRDGTRHALRVRTEEWQEDPAGDRHGGADIWLGLEVASVAGTDPRVERLRDMLGIASTGGMMVVAVAEGSPGAEAGIRPGDVLVSIGGYEIEDLTAWEQARTLLAGRRESLTVLVRTGTSEQYLQIVPRSAGLEN